jgi:hypothetical protein
MAGGDITMHTTCIKTQFTLHKIRAHSFPPPVSHSLARHNFSAVLTSQLVPHFPSIYQRSPSPSRGSWPVLADAFGILFRENVKPLAQSNQFASVFLCH